MDGPGKLVESIVFVGFLVLLVGGCCISLGRQEQPIAELQADKLSGPASLDVLFDISSSSDPDGTIASYELQFGDGASTAGSDFAPPIPHTYADDGYYTAVLKVTDNDGLTDHAKLHIAVSNPGPIVGFTCTPTYVRPGETVTCTACGRSVDPASFETQPKGIITYEWDFGDDYEHFSQNCTATHKYATVGSYSVGLRIYDDDGAESTVWQMDYVTVRGRIYWTEMFESIYDPLVGRILRASVTGVDRNELIPTTFDSDPRGIALDTTADRMYWTDREADAIRRAPLYGPPPIEDLITVGLSEPVGIALDVVAGKMYWADAGSGKIQRANFDGTGTIDDLIAGLNTPCGIALAVAAGKMYWTESGSGTIHRANMDGTGIESLISGLASPLGIALDTVSGKVYWTESASPKIGRANLDGSGFESLIDAGILPPFGIALDVPAGKMYWTEPASGKIRRANLDGSGVEDVVLGASQPFGIALDL
jgi:PKD repeat protein